MKNSFELRPEQWVIFGALIFLGIIGLFKAFTLPDIESATGGGKKKDPAEYDKSKIEELNNKWSNPPQLSSTAHKIYVSRLIVYKPSEGIIEPLSDEGVIQGMKVGWLKDNGLSLEDPNIAINDPDQDGFSNLEEFTEKTDPQDNSSHPDLITKLCMKDYEFVPFKMKLMGYNPDATGGGLIYQIKLPEMKRRSTRMVKEGDNIEGYEIGEFRKKIVERFNESIGITQKVDESELDVLHPILKTPVTLVFDTEIESDESQVVLHLKVPNLEPEPSSLKRGETFKIQGVSYQFLSATAGSAVVRKVETNEEFTIPKCN